MKNNFTISQRNAIVENHLWCIKAVMKQNRALIRAAKLDPDDVYQELALRLIRAVMSYDPEKGDLEQHMLNHIVVMGRLTHDPELRKTASGVSVASFSVAVDRDFSQQDGKKETDFLDVVAWRNTAEFAAKYFTKGRMAVISGRLQIRNWEDKDGNKRRTAEILAENIYFGDSKKEDDGGSASAPTQGFGAPAQSGGFMPSFGSAQPGGFVPNFGGNY